MHCSSAARQAWRSAPCCANRPRSLSTCRWPISALTSPMSLSSAAAWTMPNGTAICAASTASFSSAQPKVPGAKLLNGGRPQHRSSDHRESQDHRYLLSGDHPAGRAKATFFTTVGFDRSKWRRLRNALLRHAQSGTVTSVNETRFGNKYTVEGPLRTPSGRAPLLRSIWLVRDGETAARL